METKFEAGQTIVYVPNNTNWTTFGTILSKTPDNRFLIEIENDNCNDDGDDDDSSDDEIDYQSRNKREQLIVSSDQMRCDDFNSVFVINTCNDNIKNRLILEYNLILQTKNDKIRNFYKILRDIISNDIYKKDCQQLIDQEEDGFPAYDWCHKYNFDYVAGFLSCKIIDYLFDDESKLKYHDDDAYDHLTNNDDDNFCDYNGRIRCLDNASFESKDGVLENGNGEPLWHYEIMDTIKCIINSNGSVDTNVDCQDMSLVGWSCDLCRITINYDDWCFHCQNSSTSHDYCLQCVYTMANQIIKFEHFLAQLIHKHVNKHFNDDCIQIVVAFVVGCVKKKYKVKNIS